MKTKEINSGNSTLVEYLKREEALKGTLGTRMRTNFSFSETGTLTMTVSETPENIEISLTKRGKEAGEDMTKIVFKGNKGDFNTEKLVKTIGTFQALAAGTEEIVRVAMKEFPSRISYVLEESEILIKADEEVLFSLKCKDENGIICTLLEKVYDVAIEIPKGTLDTHKEIILIKISEKLGIYTKSTKESIGRVKALLTKRGYDIQEILDPTTAAIKKISAFLDSTGRVVVLQNFNTSGGYDIDIDGTYSLRVWGNNEWELTDLIGVLEFLEEQAEKYSGIVRITKENYIYLMVDDKVALEISYYNKFILSREEKGRMIEQLKKKFGK